MLEQVAREGRWSQDDAKTVLVLLYTREKRFADVVKLTRELSAKYPRNYLLKLETADALVSLAGVKRKEKDLAGAVQAEKEAFATFDEVLRDRNVRDSAARALDLIHFKYGEALLMAGYHDRAAKEFLAATKVDRAEAGLVTMAHLYAARSYDVAGKRDEALAQYKEVLARPNVYDAHDEAKRGLRQAYKSEAMPNRLSADESVKSDAYGSIREVATMRRLLLCLDGVPHTLIEQAKSRGLFDSFGPPTRLLSPFPTMTNVALSAMLGASPPAGYESLYFDRNARELRGGIRKYIGRRTPDKVPSSYMDDLDYQEPLPFEFLIYVAPEKVWRADMQRFRERFKAAPQTRDYFAFLKATDGLLHSQGPERLAIALESLDKILREIQSFVVTRRRS